MKYVLGLDLGGTNLRGALIDENLNIIDVVYKKTVGGDTNRFLEDVKSLILSINFEKYAVSAISIGVPGRVRSNGFIDELPNVHIKNIPLATYISEFFKIPTFIRNDAEIACVAEAIAGVGKGYPSTYFITISTGIGGCLFANGKIKNISEEIGHTLYLYKGKYYELEKIASGRGISKLLALNGITGINTKAFFEQVSKNDPLVMDVYYDWLNLISMFINEVTKIYTPSVFALTGGVMHSSSVFWNDLVNLTPNSLLKKAHFDQDAGLIGAAIYGFLKIND